VKAVTKGRANDGQRAKFKDRRLKMISEIADKQYFSVGHRNALHVTEALDVPASSQPVSKAIRLGKRTLGYSAVIFRVKALRTSGTGSGS
jgi:hypothetical protein